MLRLAWIFGFISTQDYESRKRRKKLGSLAIDANEAALNRVERSLVYDRIAVIVFLIALTILFYTVKYAPSLRP